MSEDITPPPEGNVRSYEVPTDRVVDQVASNVDGIVEGRRTVTNLERDVLKERSRAELPVDMRTWFESSKEEMKRIESRHMAITVAQRAIIDLSNQALDEEDLSARGRQRWEMARERAGQTMEESGRASAEWRGLVYQTWDKVGEAARETWLDKAGLFTRSAWMREVPGQLREAVAANSTENQEVQVIDFLNFKVGNDLYGMAGFDEFLKNEVADRLVALSISTVPKGEAHIYDIKAFSPKIMVKTYGNERSRDERQEKARALMEQARAQGIQVTFYRAGAGGDEGIFHYEYHQGKTPERVELAHALVQSVIDQARFVKHDPMTLEAIRLEAEQFMSTMRFSDQGELTDEERTLHAEARAITNKMMDLGYMKRITDDPECRLKMGFSGSRFTFGEAIRGFMFGTDSQGNPLVDDEGARVEGIMAKNEEGEFIIGERSEKYEEELNTRIALEIERLGTLTDEQIANLRNDMLARDTIGFAIQRALGKELDRNKKEGKKELIVAAFTGDAEAAYQVGALRREGRLGSELTIEDRKEILERLKAHYQI